MRFLIGTCSLGFEISCDKSLDSVVKAVVGPFLVRGLSPDYSLQLQLNLCSRFPRTRPIREIPFNERQEIVLFKGFDGYQAQVELRASHPEAVSAAIGCLLSCVLPKHNGFLLHASVLRNEDGMHLFVGRSGAGKSTIAANATGFEIVQDDKVAVRLEGEQYWGYGLPMVDNSCNPGLKRRAPLMSVNVLEQERYEQRVIIPKVQALMDLPSHVILPKGDDFDWCATFQELMSLVEKNTIYRLFFRKSTDISTIL